MQVLFPGTESVTSSPPPTGTPAPPAPPAVALQLAALFQLALLAPTQNRGAASSGDVTVVTAQNAAKERRRNFLMDQPPAFQGVGLVAPAAPGPSQQRD